MLKLRHTYSRINKNKEKLAEVTITDSNLKYHLDLVAEGVRYTEKDEIDYDFLPEVKITIHKARPEECESCSAWF